MKIPFNGNMEEVIAGWVGFYKTHFDINLDVAEVNVPEHHSDFDRLIIIAKGVSLNHVYEVMKKKFTSWKWCVGDLESHMQESERGCTLVSYAIWVRDSGEVDENLRNIPVNGTECPEDTETLLERLLHGFKYWVETGTHLDVKTYTWCPSSRHVDGTIPRVFRSGNGAVGIDKSYPEDEITLVGARRVIR